MSVQNFNHNSAYGFNNPLQPVINPPVIADRAPLTSDFAEIGTQWIDQSNGDIYFLTKVVGSIATWIVGAGASTVLSSLSVTPGPTSFVGDLTVSGDNVNISSTDTMNLAATGAGIDINLSSSDGSITLHASEDASNAIFLQADGGINSTIVIDNPNGTGFDAIVISAPAGGLDLDVDSIDIATTSLLTIDAGTDLVLGASAGDVRITGSDTVQLDGEGAFANAIFINASDAAGGIDIDAGSSGITVDTSGPLSFDSAGASNFTVAGVHDLTLRSTAGSIVITGDQAAADAVQINATSGGGVDVNAGILGMTIDSAAGVATVAVGDFDVTTSTGDINLDSTLGAIQLTSETDIRIDPNATLTMAPAATVTTIALGNISPIVGRTTTVNGGAVISAVADTLNLATGGINTNAGASKTVNIANGANLLGTTVVNVGTGTAASGVHSVNIGTGTGGGTKTISLGNTDALTTIAARGLISLNGGTTGAVSVSNVSVATAAPGPAATASAVNNVRVGAVTFTGYTQAASATMVLTLTNSFIAASSCILATVTNVGANDAQMNVSRIFPGVGSAVITIVNNGAAALNGDMQLNFWVLS